MLGSVDLGMLHHDAVAEEVVVGWRRAGESTLEDDRDALLEQLRRVAAMAHVDGRAVLLDGEDDVVARVAHAALHHRALDAEALGAERTVLADGLVGRA